MLERVLEPEVMDSAEEAADYDAMDHSAVNRAFAMDVLARAAPSGAARILDVGTGTALIPIELCRLHPDLLIVGTDLAEHMLSRGRENVARAGFDSRIRLESRNARLATLDAELYDLVMCNSVVHHIPEPRAILAELWRVVKPGGALFVRDLTRPASAVEVARLVAQHAPVIATDPQARAREERQRDLFEASLCAAFTPEEVNQIVRSLDIRGEASLTSDRHWTLFARKPK